MCRLIPLLFIIFFQCADNQSEAAKELGQAEIMENLEVDNPRIAEPTNPPAAIAKNSMIIRNGNMEFEVSKLQEVKVLVDTLVKKMEGYYEKENYNSHYNRNEYALRIRVPAENFDTLIAELEKGTGRLVSKNIQADDITEEYIDLNLRLKNNLAYLDQYNEILKKARSIKDVLEVQEKIRALQEEIESKKGRLKYLTDKVNLATLHLVLSELVSQPMANQPNFGNRLLNAFKNGVSGFLDFIIFLLSIWPFLLLFLLFLVFRRRIFGIFRKKG